MLSRRILLFLMLLLFTPDRAAGQSAGRACFWPKPLAECKSWIITEPGLHLRLNEHATGDERLMFTLSLGFMKNTSALSAFGAELFGASDGDARGGVALRARRWLSPRSALDFVGGIHLDGTARDLHVGMGSPMLMTRITYADEIAASLRLDLLDLKCVGQYCGPQPDPDQSGMSPRVYVGAELGEKPGMYGTLIGVAGLIVLSLALLASWGDWY
jgi:hypothetical protein